MSRLPVSSHKSSLWATGIQDCRLHGQHQTDAYDPPTLYQTHSPAGSPEIAPISLIRARPAQAAASFLQQSARSQLRRIGETIMPSPETCNSTGRSRGSRLPESGNGVNEWREGLLYTSYHVQICGAYNRPVTITPCSRRRGLD